MAGIITYPASVGYCSGAHFFITPDMCFFLRFLSSELIKRYHTCSLQQCQNFDPVRKPLLLVIHLSSSSSFFYRTNKKTACVLLVLGM